MRKIKLVLISLLLSVYTACGSSTTDKNNTEISQSSSMEKISTEKILEIEANAESIPIDSNSTNSEDTHIRYIEELDITVSEKGDTGGPLEVTLKNESAANTFILSSSWNYTIKELEPHYLLFSELGDHGTGVHVWIPHILDKASLEEQTDIIENPIAYLDNNLKQTIEKNCVIVNLSGKDYELFFWTNTQGEVFDTVYYGDQIEYFAEDGKLVCEIGVYQYTWVVRATITIPYIYKDGRFVIDEENVDLIIFDDMNKSA